MALNGMQGPLFDASPDATWAALRHCNATATMLPSATKHQQCYPVQQKINNVIQCNATSTVLPSALSQSDNEPLFWDLDSELLLMCRQLKTSEK
jgi:hypothetical protein